MKYFLLLTIFLTAPAYAESHVVASIKPLHSLVASVMAGDDTPTLLVQGDASPHSFVLTPSQAKALLHADLMFYMGDSFETFLRKPFAILPASTTRIAMENAPGITLYPLQYRNEDEAEASNDLHLWLSPPNAIAMTRAIETVLEKRYPEKAALYHANADKLVARLQALDAELAARLGKLPKVPFIVFHDAYQYFEKRYGLDEAGAITFLPEQLFGAKHIAEIKSIIVQRHVACVFREPGFAPRLISNLTDGTHAETAELDPEGTTLAPGPNLYFQLMRGVAESMEGCLSKR